ncbi:unnamed protein product [Adineta steineri]|uniref:C-type lectin domain-containing protein n=1 Tax=Adineta steineri TaxID=433720 RepID=A0A819A2T5_9BILA|nr:unnamed protein product [Adineta steineri]
MLSKLTLLIFLFNIIYIEQVTTQCSTYFPDSNDTDFCFYYKKNSFSWSDAYNQCMTKTDDGLLIQIFSTKQFNSLKNANIDGSSLIWLGANNFATFRDSNWHWLDGSAVDASVIPWCPDSTYETAIGAYCAAYDITLQCVTNYLCSSLLPAPCVPAFFEKFQATNAINTQAKINLITRIATTNICVISSGGVYANWWTYSVLLLNCKNIILLTIAIVILSFILILIYAILWGIQYQDIIQIPLAIVIIGCLATLCLLIVLLIILSNRTRVQRFIACMVLLLITIVVECFLMLGLILCIAYCSGYITLAPTSLEKDVTASLLSSLIASVSILFYTGILYLLENNGLDRVHAAVPVTTNVMPLTTTHPNLGVRPSNSNVQTNNHRPSPAAPVKKVEQVERATSPVDDRILQEFYSDRPKDVHQYNLEGRQYVVYEATSFTDIDTYRRELTQAMLLQEQQGLREAIDRAKGSIHASTLAEEIDQAQELALKLM